MHDNGKEDTGGGSEGGKTKENKNRNSEWGCPLGTTNEIDNGILSNVKGISLNSVGSSKGNAIANKIGFSADGLRVNASFGRRVVVTSIRDEVVKFGGGERDVFDGIMERVQDLV